MRNNILLLIVILFSITGCSLNPSVDTSNVDKVKISNTNPLQDTPVPSASFNVKTNLIADKQEVQAGEELIVTILLSDAKEGVTTVVVPVEFDSDSLEVLSIDTNNTSFPLGFKNIFDNEQGLVNISRSHSSGVTGDNIEIAKIIYKAKKKGETNIAFNPDKTEILLKNNANVSPVLDFFEPLTIAIQ